MKAWARGALAGAAATGVMTLFQLGMMCRLPAPSPDGGPDDWTPKYLTEEMLEATGLEAWMPDGADLPLSVTGHFAYGMLFGGVYAGWRGERPGGVPSGVLFGIFLWAFGYAGWVPALGLINPPHREHPNRNARLLLAHLVYGAVLGSLYHPGQSGE